ncbi:hypothetical protein K1T71_001245 [Dendrolimus kikuchii]|uniref:Uncharacterized protein n=1 Tax=Dendrolimus kikuchii TaxID=765133 RepID=A0ACC1DH31_9NEOP|nr:hypothetical protein K1T71_001245 [Dendrolimus kikuchii]
MMQRRQVPRFQRRKKGSMMNHISVSDLLITTAHLCLLCSKPLPNSSMAPAKLRRHLETVHPECKDKNKEFFVHKKEQLLESQKTMMHVTQTINEKTTEVSYLVSYRIAQAGEAHTIAENLIKPCVLDLLNITKCMFDEKSAKHLSTVPLSNDTVSRRIHDLASYVKQELFFLLQEISRQADGPLNGKRSNVFLSKWLSRGKTLISFSHCILHRQALAMKHMPSNLKLVMDEAVKIINVIKSRPLQSRLFSLLCEVYGNKHKTLLLYTEVRWLSRGKTLIRLFELRAELQTFLSDTSFNLKYRFYDKTWLFRLSFMADIFQKLNELNLSLQDFWIICIGKREIESFTSLSEFVSDNGSEMFQDDVFEELVQYLTSLRASFEKYFPEEQDTKMKLHSWIHNPFSPNLQMLENMSNEIYESLLEMSSDTSMESLFKTTPLNDFWCRTRGEYLMLAKMALNILLPFPTTYLCETGFSTYVATKTKYRNRLDAELDMRLQLSFIKPDINRLMKNKKQFHTSH